MKLATLNDGSRDGALAVVSTDLARYTPAGGVAATLQAALDDWSHVEPGLRDLFERLDLKQIAGEPFDERAVLAPLPRAFQWADASAYVNHVELVRKARGAELPESFLSDPLMYQGGSDAFLAAREPIRMPSEAFADTRDYGVDFEAEIAVVSDDVPMGIAAEVARERIRLVMLVNDVSLRGLIPAELAKGFGFFQSKPASSFSPVAVTPDALGRAWREGKLHLPLVSTLNGKRFGNPDAGVDMNFDFGRLIAHAAKTRRLSAGSIVGSGTVSNRGADGGPGKPIADGGRGYSCIAEQRMVETIVTGAAVSPYLTIGDVVRIEMNDENGRSIFGAIEQEVQSVS